MIKQLLTAVLLIISVASFAQKFGHINSVDLLALMPEIKRADAELDKYKKALEEQNTAMYKEYQTKVADYQTNEGSMADAIKEVKQKEILDLEQRIQGFQVGAQEKLAKKKENLYNPTLKKAEDAIKSVAQDNGYGYVFDTSLGSLIFAQEADDIMSLVKKRLGL